MDKTGSDINRRVCEKQAHHKEDHDKRVIYRSFTAGEKVMVQNVLEVEVAHGKAHGRAHGKGD